MIKQYQGRVPLKINLKYLKEVIMMLEIDRALIKFLNCVI